MLLLNTSTVHTYCRILTTAPDGAAVTGTIRRLHEIITAAPDADLLVMKALQNECYHALTADAEALELHGKAPAALSAALHSVEILEALRDGTSRMQPTLETYTLGELPPVIQKAWWNGPDNQEEAETLVLDTLNGILNQTNNYPLALEMIECLVTYRLAVALQTISKNHFPRRETARCIRLAHYCTPWGRTYSFQYVCHKDGEVFLMDGEIDWGTMEDYLAAIGQLEDRVPQADLTRYLQDRTAQPCFDFELEKAVHVWMGNPPLRGRLAE